MHRSAQTHSLSLSLLTAWFALSSLELPGEELNDCGISPNVSSKSPLVSKFCSHMSNCLVSQPSVHLYMCELYSMCVYMCWMEPTCTVWYKWRVMEWFVVQGKRGVLRGELRWKDLPSWHAKYKWSVTFFYTINILNEICLYKSVKLYSLIRFSEKCKNKKNPVVDF